MGASPIHLTISTATEPLNCAVCKTVVARGSTVAVVHLFTIDKQFQKSYIFGVQKTSFVSKIVRILCAWLIRWCSGQNPRLEINIGPVSEQKKPSKQNYVKPNR